MELQAQIDVWGEVVKSVVTVVMLLLLLLLSVSDTASFISSGVDTLLSGASCSGAGASECTALQHD